MWASTLQDVVASRLQSRMGKMGKNTRAWNRIMNWLTLDHSVFLIEGSNHSYQRALHCFGVLRTRREEIRALVKGVHSGELC